jgi:MoaA/NifB/PqqE/SkfB family radical SAM enzyme/Fe-S-cluster containining protein
MNSVEIHWELTDVCNLSCHHCITNSDPTNKAGLTLEQAKQAILKMKSAYVESICFTGGEPFCFNGLRDLIQFTLDNGIQPQVISNGTLFTDEILLFLKTNKIHIGVSLESTNEKNNDSIRGDGHYKKVMDFFQKASSLKCEYSLYFTLNSFNIAEVSEMLRFALDNKCMSIHINDLTFDGRAKNNSQLLINEQDNNLFIEKLNQNSNEILNMLLEGPEPTCWADTTTLLMASNGDIYHCTEVKRLNSNNVVGNILTFDLCRWIEDNQMMDYTDHECCYHVYYNEYITYVHNNPIPCFMVTDEPNICDILSLDAAFDELYQQYNMVCEGCADPDCMGYIWLLEDEANRLYESGVDVIEINENINILYTFKNENEEIDLSIIHPKCQYRCSVSKKCSIWEDRPLTCHMYPVGPESIENSFVWGLHTQCQFVRKLMDENKFSDFLSDTKKIISRISSDLRDEIYTMYTQLDDLSRFPDGDNEYITICEI